MTPTVLAWIIIGCGVYIAAVVTICAWMYAAHGPGRGHARNLPPVSEADLRQWEDEFTDGT